MTHGQLCFQQGVWYYHNLYYLLPLVLRDETVMVLVWCCDTYTIYYPWYHGMKPAWCSCS